MKIKIKYRNEGEGKMQRGHPNPVARLDVLNELLVLQQKIIPAEL